MVRALVIILYLIGFAGSDAIAHEFWLSPQQYSVEDGAAIVADIRIGHEFKGSAYSRRAGHFRRLELHSARGVSAISGTDGDRPAVHVANAPAGLATLVYVSRPDVTTYQTWDRFEAFVAHKDAVWTLERHRANGWPERKFKERYARFAKSLIAVGTGKGIDRDIGLEIEIVAERNPYADDISDGLPVRVVYQGAPRAKAQVEIFAKDASGAITITTVQTDDAGRATVPVQPGTEYLLDSVIMREADGSRADGALWESLWASLTFRTP